MSEKIYIQIKLFLLLFLLTPFWGYSQEKPKVRFVVEKGKFLFDQKSYKIYKKQSEDFLESERKTDSILKANPNIFVTVIDDRTIDFPRFDSATAVFKNKILENIKLDEKKLGLNTMSIFIDKAGKARKFRCLKSSDRKICNQIKKLIFTEDFNKWSPANYYGIVVNFDFVFSIIVDYNSLKYDLKNKWSRGSNLQKFQSRNSHYR
ncbi:hypothetical protein SAMN05421638_0009 [Kaistella treverensis]|uniref:TonB C-terminal domain-containing protein n=1 Tax=Kaistella treverensis TaxID=631455 RepID=A0A1I3J7U1_9FLAO|nr:hypothetical protein [Kaistella treverensis]SFI56332.1 hypothetical protein SAMN05421638_0009 [Kaistella treverensis]